MTDFAPTRSLLNPKFEGYKLSLLDQDDVVRRHDLPYKTSQASSYGKTPLTFEEVQSRITHNHLVLSPAKGRGIYVDQNHRVIVVDVGDTETEFTPVYELPAFVAAPQVDPVHPEYPSATFLDEAIVFLGDGRGSLYVLDIPLAGPATLLANLELVDPDGPVPRSPIPFRVHDVIRISDTTAVALLSSRHYGAASDPSKHPMKCHEFDVWAARFNLPFQTQQPESLALDIVWRRRGGDVPMLMTYHRARGAYFLLGSSLYRTISDPHPPHYEPSPDEMAPIPRAEEILDAEGPPQPTKPYPYSWTQTPDVVTVAFPLPSIITTCQIRVTFSQKTLTVHVTTPPVEGFTVPRYSAKQLWDTVRPSTSFWTWDREGGHAFGILTLHLDKQTEGTKWSHVFADAGTSSADADDADVPETLDPSELYAIREALEKYTAALKEGEDASGLGLGLGHGLPTLAQGEMDEEVDSSVGRLAFMTWIGEDGSSPPWSAGLRDSACSVLSTPLPGSETVPLSLVIKNGLDGTRHVLVDDGDSPRWKHENTFSALAFVLASKRDTRFTYHTSDVIFAFENGTQDRGGNVYIYHSSSPKDLWAKQSVLSVGQSDAGSLLGIGAIASSRGTGITIVCLCENKLIVLRNVR